MYAFCFVPITYANIRSIGERTKYLMESFENIIQCFCN